MRNAALKGLLKKSSPATKKFDFSKRSDYSKEATKDNFGSKLARAITPENSVRGLVESAIPLTKGLKWAKAGYNYLKKKKA